MTQIFVCFILLAAVACTESGKKNTTHLDTPPADTLNVQADKADLLRVLQGKWQSEFDDNYFLEVEGSKMRCLRNGQLAAESEIEVDAACQTPPCSADSTDTADGWCFVEKSPSGTRCNFVIYCTKLQLKYQPIGTGSELQEFRKSD